jgi:hypothetical protein
MATDPVSRHYEVLTPAERSALCKDPPPRKHQVTEKEPRPSHVGRGLVSPTGMLHAAPGRGGGFR